MSTSTPEQQPDIWPLLRAAGFQKRYVPARDGARPQSAMRMFYKVPGHVVVLLEFVMQRPTRDIRITELAVYPEVADLRVATAPPVERAHARFFGIAFEERTPLAVIGAATIAALDVAVPRRAERD
ncbi:hypothetical protein [Catenulispora rubra]|uniref:hypothetical protein n=1 Tax=Catenulispora rubra TaxID=280293 RepID=UPI0018922A73|nr:hypothetical protein [Catenulispora rubra]